MFLLWLSCPDMGIRPLLQFSHLLKAGPVLLTLLFSPPSSFILPSFAWFCIFFSTGQVLLSALSWCSACTSVSEGVFLLYLWREMYSTSSYSSTILFSPWEILKVTPTGHDMSFIKTEKALSLYNKIFWDRERPHSHNFYYSILL